jgi:hypothetical protein
MRVLTGTRERIGHISIKNNDALVESPGNISNFIANFTKKNARLHARAIESNRANGDLRFGDDFEDIRIVLKLAKGEERARFCR